MRVMKLIGALLTLVWMAPAASGATHTIKVIYNEFMPSRLVVKVGDEVQWIHMSNYNHRISTLNDEHGNIVALVPDGAERFESNFMGRGDVYKYTFKTPGHYRYICPIHGDKMFGYIDVVE